MLSKEIGGEFWPCEEYGGTNSALYNNCFSFLSGRTALEYVCRDSEIRSISLPSYCCSTMIEPFLCNDVKVSFYNVDIDSVSYSNLEEVDAVLLIDYFGFSSSETKVIAKKMHDNGKIVIYDSTHRLSGNSEIEKYVDYSVLSYRKWYYCNYAIARKHTGSFLLRPPERVNSRYLSVRETAARQKAKFINNNVGEKKVFLDMFSQANSILNKDYKNYASIETYMNNDLIILKRRANAKFLMDGLSYIKKVQLWKPVLHSDDTPLFVPILLNSADDRMRVQKYLISKNIYCPIHWPLSKLHNNVNRELYDRELSLVCDQRYGQEEMEREISELRKVLR